MVYFPKILLNIGYAVCHQIPARTFHLYDQPLPLCSRCTGIYLGVLLSLFFYLLVRFGRGRKGINPPARSVGIITIVFVLLMVINAFSQSLGLPTNNSARFITGILFGFSVTLFLISAFNFSFVKSKDNRNYLVNLPGFLTLLAVVVMITIFVLSKNNLALIAAGYLSVVGLLVFWILLNSTLVNMLTEKLKRKILYLYSLFIGAVLTVSELLFLYWLRSFLT